MAEKKLESKIFTCHKAGTNSVSFRLHSSYDDIGPLLVERLLKGGEKSPVTVQTEAKDQKSASVDLWLSAVAYSQPEGQTDERWLRMSWVTAPAAMGSVQNNTKEYADKSQHGQEHEQDKKIAEAMWQRVADSAAWIVRHIDQILGEVCL